MGTAGDASFVIMQLKIRPRVSKVGVQDLSGHDAVVF